MEKSTDFTGIFGANLAKVNRSKKADFVVIFRENFVID